MSLKKLGLIKILLYARLCPCEKEIKNIGVCQALESNLLGSLTQKFLIPKKTSILKISYSRGFGVLGFP